MTENSPEAGKGESGRNRVVAGVLASETFVSDQKKLVASGVLFRVLVGAARKHDC